MAIKKYSDKAHKKIGKVVKEVEKGELKSGYGDKVKTRKQAVAIGISEVKEEGLKVPEQKSK